MQHHPPPPPPPPPPPRRYRFGISLWGRARLRHDRREHAERPLTIIMADERFVSQIPPVESRSNLQQYGLVSARSGDAADPNDQDRDDSRDAQTHLRSATPTARSTTPQAQVKRKRKAGKVKLSFAVGDDDEGADGGVQPRSKKTRDTTVFGASEGKARPIASPEGGVDEDDEPALPKRRLGPNAGIANAPKVMTKFTLEREAAERDRLQKEFLSMQDEVKATEIMIPFVFYDGTNLPGGSARVRKGDAVWLFLDRCRKLGAELGVSGSSKATGSILRSGLSSDTKTRREWARVGVDDLMLVRGDVIIPHHYEFYYFIVNKTLGFDSKPLFPYSDRPTEQSRLKQAAIEAGTYNPLSRPGEQQQDSGKLEGASDDPALTKVINRQWYERNKHIYPANTWEEFDSAKDLTTVTRRDALGNAYFFS